MNKTSILQKTWEGVDFCSGQVKSEIVTYRWKNQEGREVGTSELSRAFMAKTSIGNQF